jgi:hypothetical protein
MKCKADEFCALQQGSMTVEEYTHRFIELARYAPEEVNDDDKKQDMFKNVTSRPNKDEFEPTSGPSVSGSRLRKRCFVRNLV